MHDLSFDWRAFEVSHDFWPCGRISPASLPNSRLTRDRKSIEYNQDATSSQHWTRRTPLIARDHGSTTKRQCRADTFQTDRNRTNYSTRENQHHHRNTRTRRRNQHARAEELQTQAATRQYAGDGAQAQIERSGFAYKRATTAGRWR